jgi:hypothetical protein
MLAGSGSVSAVNYMNHILQLGLITSLQHRGATVQSISACDELENRLLTDALGLRVSKSSKHDACKDDHGAGV